MHGISPHLSIHRIIRAWGSKQKKEDVRIIGGGKNVLEGRVRGVEKLFDFYYNLLEENNI